MEEKNRFRYRAVDCEVKMADEVMFVIYASDGSVVESLLFRNKFPVRNESNWFHRDNLVSNMNWNLLTPTDRKEPSFDLQHPEQDHFLVIYKEPSGCCRDLRYFTVQCFQHET